MPFSFFERCVASFAYFSFRLLQSPPMHNQHQYGNSRQSDSTQTGKTALFINCTFLSLYPSIRTFPTSLLTTITITFATRPLRLIATRNQSAQFSSSSSQCTTSTFLRHTYIRYVTYHYRFTNNSLPLGIKFLPFSS